MAEPTTTQAVDLLERFDPLRENGDIEIDIPLHSIEPAPWNPKKPIHGVYKKGLNSSLVEFGLRDRLKVWPHPRQKGRYIALDGNQRLTVTREAVEDHLAALQVVAEFVPVDAETPEAARKRQEAAFKAFKLDDGKMGPIRLKATSSPIPCRVMAEMDDADAKGFTLAFDRNHAAYDEGAAAELADRINEARERAGRLTQAARDRLESMHRPERAFIAPATVVGAVKPPEPPAEPPKPTIAASAPAPPPEAEDPWGDAPPEEPEAAPGPVSAPPAEPLIPVMFALTATNHRKLEDGILRSKARPIRSAKLLEAIERFNAADPDADLSDVYVEAMLVSLNDRTPIVRPSE